jgi:hypothetical protein
MAAASGVTVPQRPMEPTAERDSAAAKILQRFNGGHSRSLSPASSRGMTIRTVCCLYLIRTPSPASSTANSLSPASPSWVAWREIQVIDGG